VCLLADENIPGDAVDALRRAGHDVAWVRLDAPGSVDRDVLARCKAGTLAPYAMKPPATTCTLTANIAGRRCLAANTAIWSPRATVKESGKTMTAPA